MQLDGLAGSQYARIVHATNLQKRLFARHARPRSARDAMYDWISTSASKSAAAFTRHTSKSLTIFTLPLPGEMCTGSVERNILPRSGSDSPAIPEAFRSGQHRSGAHPSSGMAANATWTENEVPASSPAAALLTTETGFIGGGVTAYGSQRSLMETVLSADERDLPSLSVVLNAALTILFAREAIISVLSHVGGSADGRSPEAATSNQYLPHQLAAGLAEQCQPLPWWPRPTTIGFGCSTLACDGQTASPPITEMTGSYGNLEASETADGLPADVAQMTLKAFTIPGCQQLIVNLTKVIVTG